MTSEVNVESIDALIGRSEALHQYSLTKTHSTRLPRRNYGLKTNKTRPDQITSNLEETNSVHDWNIVPWTDSKPTEFNEARTTPYSLTITKKKKQNIIESNTKDKQQRDFTRIKKLPMDNRTTSPVMKTTPKVEVKKSRIEDLKSEIPSHTKEEIQTLPIMIKRVLESHSFEPQKCDLSDFRVCVLDDDLTQISLVNELSLSGQKISILNNKSQHLDKQQ